uniref:Chaperone protein DnaJ n=1 Tax=Anthurium amnicola TaxID=1678845 RepID=A0A1D1YJ37_9ARAE
MGGVPRPLRVVGTAAAVLLGGFLAATVGTVAVYETVRKREETKRRKSGLLCGVCKGKGFYACKLCRGSSTIQWSPLYDPVAINPCLCPTCDGKKIQRCLNCLGKGYA